MNDFPHIDGGSVLDLGCGGKKFPGAVGIDFMPAPGVDVIWDLNCYPWPFADNTFDRVISRHSIMHLASVVQAMEELQRILRPGGTLELITPHFSSDNAFTDVTSRWFFGSRSMDYFCTNGKLRYRYGNAAFELLEMRISFLHAAVFPPDRPAPNPCRWFGLEAAINRYPRLYEHFLAFIFRANEMYYRMRVVKQLPPH